jgi:P-type conjugative transfer protein TrbJ
MTIRRLLLNSCASMVMLTGTAAAQGLTVFDPFNYQENLLSSVRALEQINNQVRQLQAQALMIARMDQNLQRLGTSLAPDLQRSLGEIQSRLRDGNGLALRVQGTEDAYTRLFPRELSATLSSDDVMRAAKTRWDEEHASLQRAVLVQAEIADATGTDTRLLDDSMARSRNAVGALEAVQAGNELNALNVKQSLQLQSLLAVQSRAETIARGRDLATESESRQRFRTFLGSGSAYTAAR